MTSQDPRYHNESGILNVNSPVSGAQAVGTGAVASVGTPASSGDAAALAEAVALLAGQLSSLGLDAETTEDAAAHLADLGTEAGATQPSPGRVRRALAGLKSVLAGVAAAAGALTAVEQAAEPILRALGG